MFLLCVGLDCFVGFLVVLCLFWVMFWSCILGVCLVWWWIDVVYFWLCVWVWWIFVWDVIVLVYSVFCDDVCYFLCVMNDVMCVCVVFWCLLVLFREVWCARRRSCRRFDLIDVFVIIIFDYNIMYWVMMFFRI